jgi:hypothetical protein
MLKLSWLIGLAQEAVWRQKYFFSFDVFRMKDLFILQEDFVSRWSLLSCVPNSVAQKRPTCDGA